MVDRGPVKEMGCCVVAPDVFDDVAMISSGRVWGMGRSGSRISSAISASFNSGDGVLAKGSA